MVRNQIRFAGQARHPEAVVRIGGKQRKKRGRGMRRVADRNVQFIRRNHFEIRVAILPPILVADHSDFDGAAWRLRVLNAGDHPRRRQEQNHDNQYRNHGPRQFDLSASVNLRGLAAIVSVPLPEFDDRVGQQAENDREDHPSDREYEDGQSEDRIGGSR